MASLARSAEPDVRTDACEPSVLPLLTPQEGYDRWAETYGDNRTPVQVLEAAALERLLPDLSDLVVLDCGCGQGRVSRLALARGAQQTVGVDLSPEMLRAAEVALPSAQWIRADVLDLPFAPQTFDAVICSLVLGHVEDLERALRQIARVLRPGGVLLLSDFHPYATLRGWQRSFSDVREGRSYAIQQHLHMFEDYVRVFADLNIVLEDLAEPRYQGFPLVFVLRARKQGEHGTPHQASPLEISARRGVR
ncbi:MAG: class I SAM-dependent methyltransferase [Planctomycetota bacterium]|nr:class I SAM-dependent methyltransferase [Planctomycetota bacterium]